MECTNLESVVQLPERMSGRDGGRSRPRAVDPAFKNRLNLNSLGMPAEGTGHIAESGPGMGRSGIGHGLRGGVLQRVACVYFNGTAPVSAFAEACYRFSPEIAIRDEEAVFIEIGKSRKLFREESLVLRLSSLAARFNCRARIAIADDAPTALAMARLNCADARKLPLEALSDYASPFRPFRNDPDLSRRVDELIKVLRMLGLATIGDFATLPPGTLASRFGKTGMELSFMIRQGLSAPWPRFTPAEKIEAKADLDDGGMIRPCATLDPLLFIAKGLIDPCMARLRGRGLRASAVELEFVLENYSTVKERRRKWRFDLPAPQGSVSGLMPILRDRLSYDLGQRSLPAPVVQVEFRVLETAPGHGAQRDFFTREELEAEEWDALVGRLGAKLGKERTFVARPVNRHLPERSWTRALQALAGLSYSRAGSRSEAMRTFSATLLRDELPERPSRLLKTPQPLTRNGDVLLHAEKRARRWHIVEWQGPERLSGEWWLGPEHKGFSRDYYKVVTSSGEKLWVFASPAAQWRLADSGDPEVMEPGPQAAAFYLHGYFD